MKSKSIADFVFVGYGQIAKRHIDILKSKSKKMKIGVVSNHASDADLKNAHGDNVFIMKPRKAFSCEMSKFIVITSPSSDHLNDIKLLKNMRLTTILIEKPIAKNSKQGSQILNMIKDTNSQAFVLYNLRFSNGLKKMISLLSTKKYGNLLYAKAFVGQDLAQWRQPAADIKNTISARKETGGGVLRELSHELDYLSLIFDEINLKSAVLTNTKYFEIDVEDTAFLVLAASYKGKAIPISLIQDFVRPDKTRELELVCEDATLFWNLYEGRIAVHEPGGRVDLIFDDCEDLTKTYFNMWTSVLYDDFGAFCTCDEALKHLQLIETAESMQIGN